MYEPVQKCNSCGAGLTIDDLRVPNCKYCGTVLPHRAQAEQHAQLMGQMMGNMMAQQAQIANQWRGAFGAPPIPPAGPPAPPPGIAAMGMGSPPGAQFGPYGAPYGPYGNPNAIAAATAANVAGAMRATSIAVSLIIGLVVLVVVGGSVAAFLLAR